MDELKNTHNLICEQQYGYHKKEPNNFCYTKINESYTYCSYKKWSSDSNIYCPEQGIWLPTTIWQVFQKIRIPISHSAISPTYVYAPPPLKSFTYMFNGSGLRWFVTLACITVHVCLSAYANAEKLNKIKSVMDERRESKHLLSVMSEAPSRGLYMAHW